MNDNLFRMIAVLLFLSAASISIYHRRKADRAGGEKISLRSEGLVLMLTLRIGGLALWAGLLAYLINPGWMAWSRVDLPEWARWAGAALGVLAVALAYWVFTSLGSNVTPTVVTRSAHKLVTSGPYRWVRHPLYSMGLILFLAFALLAENAFIAGMAVLGFLALDARLPKEEAGLVERFGDEYRAYRQRTGKYLPKWNG
jgi:protein-S-isoprenylcysteine O-methyltransferase Ste14